MAVSNVVAVIDLVQPHAEGLTQVRDTAFQHKVAASRLEPDHIQVMPHGEVDDSGEIDRVAHVQARQLVAGHVSAMVRESRSPPVPNAGE
jgi:hypothetical protein